MAKKVENIKRLLFTERICRDNIMRHEIVQAGDRKFQILMDIHNGSMKRDTKLSILLPDGTWGFVTNASLLDIELMSYVATEDMWRVNTTWDRVRKAFFDYINVVYA